MKTTKKNYSRSHTQSHQWVSRYLRSNGDCVPGYAYTHTFIRFSLFFRSTKFVCANIKNSTPNSPTTKPFWVSHKPLSPVLFFILIWHILYLGWTFLRCSFWIAYADRSQHRPICEMNIFKRMDFRYGNLFIAALICSVYVLVFFGGCYSSHSFVKIVNRTLQHIGISLSCPYHSLVFRGLAYQIRPKHNLRASCFYAAVPNHVLMLWITAVLSN